MTCRRPKTQGTSPGSCSAPPRQTQPAGTETVAIRLHGGRAHTAAGASPPRGSIAPPSGCHSRRGQPLGTQKRRQVTNQIVPFWHGGGGGRLSILVAQSPLLAQPSLPSEPSSSRARLSSRCRGSGASPELPAAQQVHAAWPQQPALAVPKPEQHLGQAQKKTTKQPSSPQLGPGDADTVTVQQQLSMAPLLLCVTGELPMEKGSKNNKRSNFQ